MRMIGYPVPGHLSANDFGFGVSWESVTRTETGLVGRGHFRVEARPRSCHFLLTCGY